MTATPTGRRTRRSRQAGAAFLRGRGETFLPRLAFAVLALIAFAVMMHHGAGSSYYFDDWNFVLERREWSPHVLLYAHNEHFSLVPVVIYKLAFELFGLGNGTYDLLRAILALLVIGCGAVVYVYGRPRVGAWTSAGLAGCVMLMGRGWWDMLWAFQIGFVFCLFAGGAAFCALDRKSRTGDIAASFLLAISLGSTSLGAVFAGGVALDLALRRRWRSLWIALVPLVLYGLWYLKYGKSASEARNVDDIPRYVFDGLDDSIGALIGMGPDWGIPLAVGLVAMAAYRLTRPGPVPGRLIAIALLPIGFWSLTALSRASMGIEADTGRYIFPGAFLVTLVILEAFDGLRLAWRAQALLVAFLLFCIVGSTTSFVDGGRSLVATGEGTRASLGALELVGEDRVPPDANPVGGQPQFKAGLWAAARRQYGGSPAFSEAELRSAPVATRAAADVAFWNLFGTTAPLLAPAPPAARATGCRDVDAAVPGGAELPVPPEGLLVRASADASAQVRLRRFATKFPEDAFGEVASGQASVLRIPGDRARQPWEVSVRAPGPVEVCTPRG